MNIYLRQIQDITNNKYIRTYIKLCYNARKRATNKKTAQKLFGYIEKHHILPKSFNLGGEKDSLNYAFLTAREHFVCHKLLTFGLRHSKYYFKCLASIVAFMYKNEKQVRILSSHDYEFIRKCNSEQMKNRIPWNKGIKTGTSPKKGLPATGRNQKGIREAWNKGIPCSAASKEKNSQSNIGKKKGPLSVIIRQKMSITATKRIRYICEHCGKENLMIQHYNRWHGYKCRSKK